MSYGYWLVPLIALVGIISIYLLDRIIRAEKL